MNGYQVRLIQFLHPGGEHRPLANGWKPWTTSGEHRRTFVEQPGSHIASLGENPISAILHFWCEWECEAELICRFPPPKLDGYPRHLFRPYIQARSSYSAVSNTDPFVFGDRFRYCVCQQPSRPSLRQLARGSVILFGSHLRGSFVLDTVFVVASRQSYYRNKIQLLAVPETYRLAALEPLVEGCGEGEELAYYEGATTDEPVEGMFSFFPCRTADKSSGYPRPSVTLNDVINPALKQGLKSHGPVTMTQASALWRAVAKQVLKSGLHLGTSAELPSHLP